MNTTTTSTTGALTFVRVNGDVIGTVRRTRTLESVNMTGREWVALRKGVRLPGTYGTRKAAIAALEQAAR